MGNGVYQQRARKCDEMDNSPRVQIERACCKMRRGKDAGGLTSTGCTTTSIVQVTSHIGVAHNDATKMAGFILVHLVCVWTQRIEERTTSIRP